MSLTPVRTARAEKKAPRTKVGGAKGWGRDQPKESLQRVA